MTALRHLVLAGAAELGAWVVADEGGEAVEVVRGQVVPHPHTLPPTPVLTILHPQPRLLRLH